MGVTITFDESNPIGLFQVSELVGDEIELEWWLDGKHKTELEFLSRVSKRIHLLSGE